MITAKFLILFCILFCYHIYIIYICWLFLSIICIKSKRYEILRLQRLTFFRLVLMQGCRLPFLKLFGRNKMFWPFLASFEEIRMLLRSFFLFLWIVPFWNRLLPNLVFLLFLGHGNPVIITHQRESNKIFVRFVLAVFDVIVKFLNLFFVLLKEIKQGCQTCGPLVSDNSYLITISGWF